MFGIGMQELVLILVIALIILGPKNLPDVAKSLAKALNEFKRATGDIKESLGVDQNSLNSVKKSFDVMNDTPPAAASAAPGPSEVKPPSPSPEEAAPKTPEPPRATS
jgi:sec-independent protein translocase protein TatB